VIAALLVPLLPAAALAVNVAVQLIVVRTCPGWGIAPSIGGGFLAGLAAVAAGSAFPAGAPMTLLDGTATGIADLAAYLCLSYCYFNFLNLGITARRIRLLIELLEAPAGLTWEEILQRSDARHMVQARLGRLLTGGQVRERGGRYTIGAPHLLLAARAIILLKVLFLGKRSEFEQPGRPAKS
jgi:hypothetical protein